MLQHSNSINHVTINKEQRRKQHLIMSSPSSRLGWKPLLKREESLAQASSFRLARARAVE